MCSFAGRLFVLFFIQAKSVYGKHLNIIHENDINHCAQLWVTLNARACSSGRVRTYMFR